MAAVVEARELVKKYKNFMAVKGISFSINRGECFGFLGPNGAGKTTTVAMIYCFLPVTAGELKVLGKDVKTDYRQIKSRLGVVWQENNLDPELTVFENLVVYASYFGISTPEAQKRAEELLNYFDLADKRNVTVDNLSGGMKRRLAIARGLINRPDLLILDEPTTGLDPEARRLIWQRLLELKEQGMTLILTTHYLEEASQLCDRLVIMDQGRILEEGKPADLVEKHIGRHVIELRVPTAEQSKILQLLQEYVQGYTAIGEMLFLYPGKKAAETLTALDRLAGAIYYRLQRPANLEDVFLKLTGRGLKNDQKHLS
ncbi:ABC transporter ATP-binding protein [Calderihabitans maritimus]|uniref:Phosphonate-transporting ATPase n=1 Tax=Calderihabitans maritimus TaxID=1246530 RepID=A0A1Z5HXB5_9FIRM|nr:ABC transporter ATP-binding protein [Calderihabitans maritimus]GAW93955.1 phosphonate-transporting ATPase [Calderihabitans maritimus]